MKEKIIKYDGMGGVDKTTIKEYSENEILEKYNIEYSKIQNFLKTSTIITIIICVTIVILKYVGG